MKVLSEKQANTLRDELRLFMDEVMGTTVPPIAAVLRETKHKGIRFLAVCCRKNLVIVIGF